VIGRRGSDSGCDARRHGIRGCMMCVLSSGGKLKVEVAMEFRFLRSERASG